MPIEQRYQLRGVSAEKEDIHKAIKNLTKDCILMLFAKSYPTSWEETMSSAI